MIEILIGADPHAAPVALPTVPDLGDGMILTADEIFGCSGSVTDCPRFRRWHDS